MESERIEMQKSLVNEISRGMGQLKQVKVSSEQERFLERMVSCYEEALFILTGHEGQCQSPSSNPPAPSPPAPSPYVRKQEGGRGARRKRLKRTYKINAASEGSAGDGYSWRKYGQKWIKGSVHQRSYFRCTHKYDQGCRATKQVRKLNDDPTVYDITYGGVHTCQAGALASKPNLEEEQE